MILLGLLACGEASPKDCLSRYTVEHGYGYGGADVDAVEAACERGGGTGCRAEDYLTRDAAECLAEADGLEDGTEPWVLYLGWMEAVKRPVWTVSNTLAPGEGELRVIDAVTGAIRERSAWP